MRLRHGLFVVSLLMPLLAAVSAVTAQTVLDCNNCKIIIEKNGTVKIRDQAGKIVAGVPAELYSPVKPVDPLPAMPTGYTPPPPPKTIQTIDVCLNGEAPDCLPSVEAVLDKQRGGGLHIRVHCGSYQGGTVDLRRRSHIWIEGVPCKDGSLPLIGMKGRASSWIEFSPMGGPEVTDLRIEKLHLTGPGERTAAIRLNGKGPMVVKDVVVDNQENGVFVTQRASGDVWVINSRFNMNGHGPAGKRHHIYVSCTKPGCRTFVVNSYFGGLYSKNGRNCSNQIRFRAREAFVLNSVFDAREGCVSRSLNTSPQNERLIVRDSIFIQGNTENSQIMMTPLGGGTSGELDLENIVAVSERDKFTRLIGVLANSRIRLKNVLIYAKANCSDKRCVFSKEVEKDQVQTFENVRVVDSTSDLPKRVREML